jgi:hypothetical protein
MYVCMYICMYTYSTIHIRISKFKCVFTYRNEFDESQIKYAVYDAVMGKEIYDHLESQGNLVQFFDTF